MQNRCLLSKKSKYHESPKLSLITSSERPPTSNNSPVGASSDLDSRATLSRPPASSPTRHSIPPLCFSVSGEQREWWGAKHLIKRGTLLPEEVSRGSVWSSAATWLCYVSPLFFAVGLVVYKHVKVPDGTSERYSFHRLSFEGLSVIVTVTCIGIYGRTTPWRESSLWNTFASRLVGCL